MCSILLGWWQGGIIVDILFLVDRLENLITSSRRMPMNRVLVREQEVLQLIDQMRAVVPEEVKQARRIYQERGRMLAQAQAEASRIIAAAREEADRLVNDEKMVQLAMERATDIEREAEEHARHLRDGADAYAAETLRGLEEQLTNLQTQIDQTLLSIHKGLETLVVRSQEGEEEEVEETPVQREMEEAAVEEEQDQSITRMPPRRTAHEAFPAQSVDLPQRLSAPLPQMPSDESLRINEHGTIPQRKR
jgi:hypothetical protein